MSHSVVRWQVLSDIWTFEDDIKPSATNPYGTRTSAHSMAVWSVEPDTWVHFSEKNIITKYFIKASGLIYKLNSNGEFIKVEVGTPATREDFETYGFDDLGSLVSSKDKVILDLEEGSVAGEGKVYKKSISGYGKILGIRNLD